MDNSISLYSLEEHLFSTVGPAFRQSGRLTAFDFFCIVIWKANRAKSKVAERLLARDAKRRGDLEAIVGELASALYSSIEAKERLRILFEDWDFRLPMASAILAVLWPEDFTVYDIRVCEALGAHHALKNRTKFDTLWAGYQDFRDDVVRQAPASLSLRDKGRFLWGKSFGEQLSGDLKRWAGKGAYPGE